MPRSQSLLEAQHKKRGSEAEVKGERESNASLILPECYLAGVLQTVLSLQTLKLCQAFMCRIRVCGRLFSGKKHQHNGTAFELTTPLNMFFPKAP